MTRLLFLKTSFLAAASSLLNLKSKYRQFIVNNDIYYHHLVNISDEEFIEYTGKGWRKYWDEIFFDTKKSGLNLLSVKPSNIMNNKFICFSHKEKIVSPEIWDIKHSDIC